jgi:2-dehydropantoate 2-reductase
VAAGREPELDAIGGAVLRAAARHGIPVPATEELIEIVRRRIGA